MIALSKLLPAVFIAITVSSSLSGYFAYQAGKNSVQVKWDADRKEQLEKTIELEEKYRALESQASKSAMYVADTLHTTHKKQAEEYENTIADLNSGALILRERFRGCERQLSESKPATESPHGGSGSGFTQRDKEDILRVGRKCDAQAAALQGWQLYAQGIAKVCFKELPDWWPEY